MIIIIIQDLLLAQLVFKHDLLTIILDLYLYPSRIRIMYNVRILFSVRSGLLGFFLSLSKHYILLILKCF